MWIWFFGVVLDLGLGRDIPSSFQSSGQVKILVPPCLHLFGWPVLFALWDRRVETAVFCCHWNFCLIAKHHGLLFVEVIPLCWPGKSSAAAFYKIPEVVVIWANPGFEIGKDCFHHPYFKPPLPAFPPYVTSLQALHPASCSSQAVSPFYRGES